MGFAFVTAFVTHTQGSRQQTSGTLVCLPRGRANTQPLMEAHRAAEDLKHQICIETAFVVTNYLLPEEYGDNAFFANRRAQQQQYLGEIKDHFETPMMLAPIRQNEPVGLAELSTFCDAVTGLAELTNNQRRCHSNE